MKVSQVEIPARLISEINSIAPYLDEIDWLSAKSILLRSVPSDLRSLFSRRRDDNKMPRLNNFEIAIIDFWNSSHDSKIKLSGCEERIN